MEDLAKEISKKQQKIEEIQEDTKKTNIEQKYALKGASKD